MKKKRTITKLTIFLKMLPWREAFFTIIGQVVFYFSNEGSEYVRIIGAIMGLGLVYLGIPICLQRGYLAIVGMIRLTRQEKILGFRFNDEMKKYHVTTTQYKSADWYIDVRHNHHYLFTFIILRKDFIDSLDKIRISGRATGTGIRYSLVIRTINGKKQTIFITFTKYKDVIFNFKKWYHQGIPNAKGKPSRRNRINKKKQVMKMEKKNLKN